jgi:hypothetical protein
MDNILIGASTINKDKRLIAKKTTTMMLPPSEIGHRSLYAGSNTDLLKPRKLSSSVSFAESENNQQIEEPPQIKPETEESEDIYEEQ